MAQAPSFLHDFCVASIKCIQKVWGEVSYLKSGKGQGVTVLYVEILYYYILCGVVVPSGVFRCYVELCLNKTNQELQDLATCL